MAVQCPHGFAADLLQPAGECLWMYLVRYLRDELKWSLCRLSVQPESLSGRGMEILGPMLAFQRSTLGYADIIFPTLVI
jgi:hypothetical protein